MAAIDDIEASIDEEMFTEELDALTGVIDCLHAFSIEIQSKIITSAEVFLGHGKIKFSESHDEFGDDIASRSLPGGPPYPKKDNPQ